MGCIKEIDGALCGREAKRRVGLWLCDEHYYDFVSGIVKSQFHNYDTATLPGFAYVAARGADVVKIGSSTSARTLAERTRSISRQTGVTHTPIRVYPGGVVAEHEMHSDFRHLWVGGENYRRTGELAEYLEENPGIPFTLRYKPTTTGVDAFIIELEEKFS
jgi:hypothetical protein